MTPRDPVEFRLFDTDLTSVIGILPAKSMNLFLLLNEPGSGEVSIPLNSRANSQIASDMFVETKYRGGVRGGFFVENIGRDFAKTNEVEDQVVSISGRGALALLDDAIVWDDGTGASTRTFTGTRAGILIELIEEAKVRGALLNLDYDFSATHDSDSEGWTDADDEPLTLTIGTSLLEIARRIAKVGTDFTMTPDGTGSYVLSAYKNGIGEDKSATVYFRVGLNCEEVSSLETGGEIKNALKIKYNGGFAQVQDNTSIGLRRRREGIRDISYTSRPETAITFGSAELQLIKDPKKQITLKVYDGIGPRVFVDYGLGDRVTLDINGEQVDYRVRGLQLTWNGEKFADVVVDLNSIILENEIRMAQDISYLMEQWRNAHDAGLLEVSFWANIGDLNVDYTPTDMLIVGDTLYVTSSSNLHIYNISNGAWNTVALGENALCLTNVGTDIYIGCIGGVKKWDGSSVTVVATVIVDPPEYPPVLPRVNSITSIGNKIYFGGLYTDVLEGSLETTQIVEYDTVADTWDDIGGLANPLDLITNGSGLVACNLLDVQEWDTSSWSSLGTLTGARCLAMRGNTILVGGSFTDGIAEWNGVTWDIVGDGVNGIVYAVATYLTDIYVAGSFTDKGSKVARYSGGLWWELEGGVNDDATELQIHGTNVYVAGADITIAGDKSVNSIAVYFNNFESLLDYMNNTNNSFDLAAAIHNAIPKTSMAANDEMGFWDSISQKLRKITWSNILLSIKTYTDGLYVDLTGNQTVAGVKTFSSFPVTPSSAPTTDYQVANKKYVDDNVGGGSFTGDPARVVITDVTTGAAKTVDDLQFNETDASLTIGNPAGTGDGDGSYLHGLGGDIDHEGVLSTFHNLVTYAGDNARASLVKLITSLGTKASPLAVTIGTLLGRLRFAGYDGDTRVVDSATSADVKGIATEDFDSSGHGTKIVFSTTPNNSTTMQDVMEIGEDGQITLNEYGSGTHTGTLSRLLGVSSTGDVIEVVKDSYPSLKVDENDEATLRQRMDGDLTYLEHFDGSSMPARFTWAGSPFVTPTTINHSTNSQLIISNTGTWRAFLYDTALPTNNSYLQSVIRYVAGVTNYGFVGLRYDDGSDSNYIELGLYNYGSGYHVCKIYKRSGGGAVTETTDTVNHYLPHMFVIGTSQWGTEWTNWGCNLNLGLTNQGAKVLLAYRIGVASLTWTPSRFGIAFRGNAEVISLIEAYTKD